MTGLLHVSLFSGIGGIDLAVARAGMPTVLACEADRSARGVLADRFPGVPAHHDVRTLTGDTIRRYADPGRAVLSAGWPCQGNSVAGRRAGMDDERSGLWGQVARIVAELRPAWFLGENVPGLLSVNAGRDFATVLGDLAHLGYGVAWRVLDARFFGVPQRRRRVVLVARAGDDGRAPAQVLLEPEGGGRDLGQGPAAGADHPARAGLGATAGGRLRVTAFHPTQDPVSSGISPALGTTTGGTAVCAAALGASAGGADDNDATGGRLVVAGTAPTLQAAGGRRGCRLDAETAAGGGLVAYQQHGSNVGPMGTLRKGNGSHTGGVPFLATWQKTTRSGARGPDGSLPPEVWEPRDTAATLACSDLGSDARAVELVTEPQTTVRRLTPVECERLQGLPDGWTATSAGRAQSDSARYQQLGNSVAVPVFAWVARRLIEVDGAAA